MHRERCIFAIDRVEERRRRVILRTLETRVSIRKETIYYGVRDFWGICYWIVENCCFQESLVVRILHVAGRLRRVSVTGCWLYSHSLIFFNRFRMLGEVMETMSEPSIRKETCIASSRQYMLICQTTHNVNAAHIIPNGDICLGSPLE